MSRNLGPRTLVLSAGALFAGALFAFVAHDRPASFADDSASYLIMARYFSPFGHPDVALTLAYADNIYPPVFPLLLAWTGSAWNLVAAHVLVAVCLLCALIVLYALARRLSGTGGAALALVAAYALLPGTWINTLSILSENLYLLLSLLFLYRMDVGVRDLAPTTRGLLLDSALLAALVLTRTVGVAMLGAYALVVPLRRHGLKARLTATVPLLPALLALLLWELVSPNRTQGYLAQVAPVLARTFLGVDNGYADLGTVIQVNLALLPQAALEYLAIDPGHLPLATAAVFAISLLAGLGVVLRLRQGGLEAYYTAAYLGVLLCWPYPGENYRFLHPVAPLLLLAATYSLRWLAGLLGGTLPSRPAFGRPLGALALLLLAATSAPALAVILTRSWEGTVTLRPIAEYYRFLSLPTATRYAETYSALMDDLAALAVRTPRGAVVAAAKPSFLTLLSGRYAVRLLPGSQPKAQVCSLIAADAGYAFVSQLYDGYNHEGLGTLTSLASYASPTWMRHNPDGTLAAVLLVLDPERLHGKGTELGCGL